MWLLKIKQKFLKGVKMYGSNKIKTQKQNIKEYLEDGLGLTKLGAFKNGFGMNLSSRISELKKDGLAIKTRPYMIGSREVEYYL